MHTPRIDPALDHFLLRLVLSTIACPMMFGFMLTLARQTQLARDWLPTIQSTFPDSGWALLVLAGVVLCLAVSSSRPRYTPLPEPRPS